MVVNRLYYQDSEPEGGGNPPPKKILTPQNKRDWNDFLDHLQSKGVAGSKDLDQPDKKSIKGHIDDYKKENPNTTVSEDMIPLVQSEHQALRNGDSYAGLSLEHTKVLRQQLNGNYMKRPVAQDGGPFDSTMSRQYFPEFKKGDKNYGTDAQAYMKDFLTRPASDSTAKSPENTGGTDKPKGEENLIPYPDYNDQKSRNQYLEKWQKKYGPLYAQGDTVLKVNEVPRGASDTIKNISVKAAKEYGLDPALLYSSMMREGGAGLFKNKDGTDTRHRKPGEYGYQGFYGDKEFPINGNESFGVPDFAKRFPDLVKGGYLPKSFESKFRGTKNAGEYSENDFKSVEDGMKAKAALMKQSYDEVDKYAKQEGITLSKNAKDFFALADFNSGANFKKILKRYNDEGLLKDDKFLKEHPHKNEVIDPKDDVWAHVAPRLRMASALKEQKHFDSE